MILVRLVAAILAILISLGTSVAAASNSERPFNYYMVRAYQYLKGDPNRSRQGYSLAGYFTKNLDYGQNIGSIKAKNAPLTMCNAAVTEVFIEAINLYAKDHPDWSPSGEIAIELWNGSDWQSLRPHFFGHNYFDYPPLEGIPSSEIPKGLKTDIRDFQSEDGMYSAFEKFGLGYRIEFKDARPGDVITLDRAFVNKDGKERYSGHSVVFLGFLNRKQEVQTSYDPDQVVGFKYFSSQGTQSDGGLDERWAYFKGMMCPFVPGYQLSADPKRGGCADAVENDKNRSGNPAQVAGQKRDCCVKRDGSDGLRVARLLPPSQWSFKTSHALVAKKYIQLRKDIEQFIQNRKRANERIRLIAQGTKLLEANQPRVARDFKERVDRQFNVDLSAISSTGVPPELSPGIVNAITKLAPKAAIDKANETVTDSGRSKLNDDVKQAGAKAIENLTNASGQGGIANKRLDGTSVD